MAMILFLKSYSLTAYLFIWVGALNLVMNQIYRYKWLQARLKNKSTNSEVEISFTEEGIETKGVFSAGRLSWQGIEKCVETSKGLFIYPQQGIHIYIPKKAVTPEQEINSIVELAKNL
ncbi:MAG: YcxB family protein [Candidatus Omnitrophica bacterium]|nr:YcxB family protein [Candidatus Omnitrophota bacterium]